MIQSRKGLSDIVTNVLIILLVLVAIGIIWAFVRPSLNQGASQLEGQADCLTIQMEAKSCVKETDNSYSVQVFRGAGEGDFKGYKVVFKDVDGNTKSFEKKATTDVIDTLGQVKFTATATDLGAFVPTSVDVASIVDVKSNPEGRTCDLTAAPVACA
ncbi:MAG: hypothetical protein AABX53_03605 [Nanoarchaeota archaeon]